MPAIARHVPCFAALTVATLFVLLSTGSAAASPAEERAIRDALDRYASARARGDLDDEMRAFTEDADVWSPLGRRPHAKGNSEIRQGLAGPPQPFRIEPVDVSFPDDDVALVDAKVFGPDPSPSSMAIYVLVKRKGAWLIRSLRIMRIPPAAAPALSPKPQ